MKKFILLQLTALFLFGAISVTYAQSDAKYKKTMEQVYKQKSKEFKKGKWAVTGTSLTLDAALMKHLRTLNADNNDEIVYKVEMCKSANVCRANALNNALVEYAQKAGSYIRGRVTSDMFNDASANVPTEFDKFYAAYERLVQAEVKGALDFSFAVERPNGEGKTYEAYYIVNEEKASRARLRAMQLAFEETQMAQKYAEQVSKFVQEGFKNE